MLIQKLILWNDILEKAKPQGKRTCQWLWGPGVERRVDYGRMQENWGVEVELFFLLTVLMTCIDT
jgi:hypothetical protein